MTEEEAQEQRERIADRLERVHVGDLPGPEVHRHWVRFALNRQADSVRRGVHG